MKENLYSFTLDQLSARMVMLEQKPFRAKQLFSWMYKKDVNDICLMSDISKVFKEELENKFNLDLPTIFTKQICSSYGNR